MNDKTEPLSTVAVDPRVMRLRRYNEWRRGADFEQPEPAEIGNDIDAAADELERMSKLLETPIGWRYTIAPYCDHGPATGFVVSKSDLSDRIPADKVTWHPVYLGA